MQIVIAYRYTAIMNIKLDKYAIGSGSTRTKQVISNLLPLGPLKFLTPFWNRTQTHFI